MIHLLFCWPSINQFINLVVSRCCISDTHHIVWTTVKHMVMDTEYPVYFTFTSTFTSGSWWIWFCKNIWCSWTVHLSTDIYPMVFVNILQLLYTNCIYWRPYVIHHAKIVLNRTLVWIVNIYITCLAVSYMFCCTNTGSTIYV